jgi:hypothetical protein
MCPHLGHHRRQAPGPGTQSDPAAGLAAATTRYPTAAGEPLGDVHLVQLGPAPARQRRQSSHHRARTDASHTSTGGGDTTPSRSARRSAPMSRCGERQRIHLGSCAVTHDRCLPPGVKCSARSSRQRRHPANQHRSDRAAFGDLEGGAGAAAPPKHALGRPRQLFVRAHRWPEKAFDGRILAGFGDDRLAEAQHALLRLCRGGFAGRCCWVLRRAA